MNKLHKEIILGAVVVLFGIFSWWFLKYVFYIGNLTLSCWISGIVLLILWGISLCLAMLLIDNKNILYGSFILCLIAFGMFFNNEPFYYLIGLIILFLAFWISVRKVRKEEKGQVSLDFWRIWKRGLPILITALILLVSLVYYFSPLLTKMRQLELELPRNVFDTFIKRLPVEFDLDKDELYELVNSELNEKLNPSYKKVVPIALAVGLFVVLKIISILYIALLISFAYLILKLLIILKFTKIEIKTKEVETVKL